ncbi:siroheme synthase CysG [Thalassospiraceae bacterium LMO-SO8]|nr:siroheme synthase CysG [Alphaproteobacteria bacterium LMO-S08]WND76902.1 siroheme synthase CysG [Thalassospiraceae bacterium LMO-SO8]
MRQFPIFFSVQDRPVVIAGGGEAAARKLRLLLKAGAVVTVVAPDANDEILDLFEAGDIEWTARAFVDADVAGAVLAYGATGIDAVDRQVSAAARKAGVPVNVVDRPELSDFITPAIVERDAITVAVSSGGTAPVLARGVKAAIERLLPPNLGRLALFAERFRGAVKAVVPDGRARLRFWDGFFDGPIAARVLAGDEQGAAEDMLSYVNRRGRDEDGIVHIVGAGPGAADLITLRGQRLLEQADVIVHDRLVGDGVLDLARRDADRIDVGKTPGRHPVPQDKINDILIAQARLGKRVVRLKGGDPFIFGRGGEELQALNAAGVRAEVVPGITAATACAAATGIPLTHRGHASAVTFVTGHLAREKGGDGGAPDVDWAALARSGATLAVYMGIGGAGAIANDLSRHGLADTPVAVIENGTRPDQRVFTGHVRGLDALVRANGVTGPALIVIGDVTALADMSSVTGGQVPLAAAM